MDRRKTGIIALATTGALAASAAVALSVPTSGTMPQTEAAAIEQVIEPTSLFSTRYTLPEGYVGFYLDDTGALASRGGDPIEFEQPMLDSITAQLQAAPERSALIVDPDSLDTEGLTAVLTTVTPTKGMQIASTNEEMQQWLAGLFGETEGTMSSQGVANIPNAAFSTTQTSDELTWFVTEYIYQFGDATVSARMSTVDDTGAAKAEIDDLMASMTRG